ncbi:transketolase [Desulfothermus sp.]
MVSRRELANAIRALSMDAIQKANSGHPGAPMGMADIAEVLWRDFVRHNPQNPKWPNRDRVILSNGHASMLLYSVLHLTGYDLTIEDIKNFRQLGSKTPGHPEYGITPGVETTTGPLGQGLANAVGMALAEKILAATFNKHDVKIVDHYTYVLLGDGCLMEGISHEACSLAATWGLGKLIALYDDNGITIDGPTEKWFTEDIKKRFESYGWHVICDVDGHNPDEIYRAIDLARKELDRPSLICFKTQIGFGSPNLAGSEKTHGAPLGEEEVKAAKKNLGWKYAPFEIPEHIYKAWDAREKGKKLEDNWNKEFEKYKNLYPEEAKEFLRRINRELPSNFTEVFEKYVEEFLQDKKDIATRKASGIILDKLAANLPELIGGSADLSGSNNTKHSRSVVYTKDSPRANYLHFGVREFAMAGIMNGLALYSGFIPYGGTFLVFSDYMRNAIRLSSLMELKVLYILTHDSIGVGEDGPTHQPIEHVSSLRLIPDLKVFRPCDIVECAAAYYHALCEHSGPMALILSRQGLKKQLNKREQYEGAKKGGYILLRENGDYPKVILIATGSEVGICVEAATILNKEGIPTRVVSMVCTELFDEQDSSYKDMVLDKRATLVVAVEAGSSDLWYKYVGDKGFVLGIDEFGKSAPGRVLFKHYGFVAENIVNKIKERI